MGDTYDTGTSEDEVWLRQSFASEHGALHRHAKPGHPPMEDSHSLPVGPMGMSAQCQECGQVCMAHHDIILTDNDTGESRTIPGAWVGPPGDPVEHFFPFRTPSQVNIDRHSATSATEDASVEAPPKPKPAGIPANAPGRSRTTPSRSPEARRAEYERRKRKARRV